MHLSPDETAELRRGLHERQVSSSIARLDAVALDLAVQLLEQQPRGDATIAQLPVLGVPLPTSTVPIYQNGQTYQTPISSLAATAVVGNFFNVFAYGAVGNGSTSDTNAIQSAINAASANGGGVVYLPGGFTFASAGNINPASNVTLFAYNATILASGGSGNSVFSYSGATANPLTNFFMLGGTINLGVSNETAIQIPRFSCTNVAFKDVVVKGGGGGMTGQAVAIGAVYSGDFVSNHCSQILFHNCDFQAVAANTFETLDLVSCDNSAVVDCNFIGCGGNAALGVYGYCNNVAVNGCNFSLNPAGEFFIIGGQNISVTGCNIQGFSATTNAYSQIINAKNVSFEGCVFNGQAEANTPAVVQFDYTSGHGFDGHSIQFPSSNIKFTGCSFNNYSTGITFAWNTGANYTTTMTNLYVQNCPFVNCTNQITYTNVPAGGLETSLFTDNQGFNPAGFQASGPQPTTTNTPVINPFPFPCQVAVSGGSGVTNIKVQGTNSGLITGTFIIGPGATITPVFTTTAPAFVWYGI